MAPKTRPSLLTGRNPLSDITNSSSLIKYTPKSKPDRRKFSSARPARSRSTSIASSDSAAEKQQQKKQITPYRDKHAGVSSEFAAGVIVCKFKHSVVSRLAIQESRKGKGKAIADPSAASCPPMQITNRARFASDQEHSGIIPARSFSEPSKKSKKRTGWGISVGKDRKEKEDPELKDFIKKQKAYFDELDKFELPVEEVSEDEISR